MHNSRAQLTISAVALILGMLVVVQLRAQDATPGLSARSNQNLTELVANLTSANERLRTDVATLEREATELEAAQARGETTLDQLRDDLDRVRAWAGVEAVSGPGVRVSVAGPIAGAGVEDLLNELRNSSAEAMAVDGTRVVAGGVVAGAPGGLTLDGVQLGDPFEVQAIGVPEALAGSLLRVGGVVTQLGATYEGVTLTVTPVDQLELPATGRDLRPVHGAPRL